ncbi:MAG: fused MFS/spermidine synthase [Acidobacteria bacterium]|nr:fused MFS/spermidine synthase [Acidobacteriota bacterium]
MGLLAALLALTGAAALADEVAWTRWLTLALGSGSRATIVVLATFMAGLGVGSWLGGRIADAWPRRALRLFAAAEALVAGWTLLSIPLLGRWLPAWAGALAQATGTGPLPTWARVALAVVALAPPTVLMGATLPILARWIADARLLPGRSIGALYTANTLGGAAGTLLATFVLIDAWGLSRTVLVAALADLLVAGLVFLAARRATPAPAPGRTAPSAGRTPAADPGVPFAATATAFLASGLVGLGLEVAFHRALAIVVGSTVYAFAVMLAAFLVGIAAGSAIASRLADRGARPAAALAIVLGGLGLGTGLVLRLLDAAFVPLGRAGARLPGLSGWPYSFELAGCFASLLPATLMLGCAVPLVARLCAPDPERLARRFGLAYALNTAGSVAGAVLAGAVLVPALGTAGTMRALVLAAALAGVAVAAWALPRPARTRPLLAAGALGLAGLAVSWGADPVRATLLEDIAGRRALAFREGPVQTIAVVEDDNEQQLRFLRLITNRTSLTGTHVYAQRYMRLLGHLPVLWSADPRRALVICLGTGMTASAVAAHPEIRQLDIAEISPEVVDVAPLFDEASGRVLADPRVRLFVEDGRHVLLASPTPWDVITLEPPPPRESGVVSLYTTEFYELCRRRLAPGGVVAQWIPLHSHTLDEVRLLVRSFLDAFPHAAGFLPVERELIVLGAEKPLVADPGLLARRMAPARVQRELARIGFDEPADLLATALFDRAALERLAANSPAATDDRPRIEYFARFGKRPALPDLQPAVRAAAGTGPLVAGTLGPAAAERFRTAREALLAYLESTWAYEARRGEQGDRLALEAVRLRPTDPFYLWAAGLSDEHVARARARAERSAEPRDWQALGMKLFRRGDHGGAETAYRRALAVRADDPETLRQLGLLLLGEGRVAEARDLLGRALAIEPRHPSADGIRRVLEESRPRE